MAHFRTAILRAVGGWDPHNVTEDADLGVRLARHGYRTVPLASPTYEEAPFDHGGWLRQRTRWMLGWIQTFLVHNRAPFRLMREAGGWRAFGFQMVIGGVVAAALVHPWFYAVLVLEALPASLTGSSEPGGGFVLTQHSTGIVYQIAVASFAFGYSAAICCGAAAWLTQGRVIYALSALLIPIYWLLISLACYRACWKFVTAPWEWEKTTHGNAQRNPKERERGRELDRDGATERDRPLTRPGPG
ncbi:MAG: glycosyltransferase family 2 protein [Pseudomonadota bacterium]